MPNLNKLAHGEIHITYKNGPDIFLPIRLYAASLEDAQRMALRKAIADLIIDDSPALEGAISISVDIQRMDE